MPVYRRELVRETEDLPNGDAGVVLFPGGDDDGYVGVVDPDIVDCGYGDGVDDVRCCEECAVYIAYDQFYVVGGGEWDGWGGEGGAV